MYEKYAFIFMTAEPDSSKSAIEELKNVEGVVELCPSRGACDIIARVRWESLERLSEVTFKQIRNLGSTRSTLSLMVI